MCDALKRHGKICINGEWKNVQAAVSNANKKSLIVAFVILQEAGKTQTYQLFQEGVSSKVIADRGAIMFGFAAPAAVVGGPIGLGIGLAVGWAVGWGTTPADGYYLDGETTSSPLTKEFLYADNPKHFVETEPKE